MKKKDVLLSDMFTRDVYSQWEISVWNLGYNRIESH